jgi:glutamate decarboxylase
VPAQPGTRTLVKFTLGHSLADTLAANISEAGETLRQKGIARADRRRVKTGTGY